MLESSIPGDGGTSLGSDGELEPGHRDILQELEVEARAATAHCHGPKNGAQWCGILFDGVGFRLQPTQLVNDHPALVTK